MNERIRQLVQQAQILTDKFQEQWKAGPSTEEFFHEKFAEMIVAECVGIADEYDGVGSTIVGRIEKHFGVKE